MTLPCVLAYSRPGDHVRRDVAEHLPEAPAHAGRPDGRIRVVLPDPSVDSILVALYAQTLGIAPDDLRGRVQAAIADLRAMEPCRHVEVYVTTRAFRHAVYLLSDRAVLALYALCGERIPTPAMLVSDSVIRASQAITDEFYYNKNVIDDKEFPPHLSLHICTVPREKIQQVVDGLGALAERIDLPDINPVGIEPSYGGYVMLNIERTTEIMALHEAVLKLAATAREGVDTDKYGSECIRDSFVPHASLAKVDRRDLTSATDIGRKALGSLHPTRTRTLDLCDIGPRSERWDVLASFPIRPRSP